MPISSSRRKLSFKNMAAPRTTTVSRYGSEIDLCIASHPKSRRCPWNSGLSTASMSVFCAGSSRASLGGTPSSLSEVDGADGFDAQRRHPLPAGWPTATSGSMLSPPEAFAKPGFASAVARQQPACLERRFSSAAQRSGGRCNVDKSQGTRLAGLACRLQGMIDDSGSGRGGDMWSSLATE